jgi:hypothetical protein
MQNLSLPEQYHHPLINQLLVGVGLIIKIADQMEGK